MNTTETTNYLVVTYTTTYVVRDQIAGKTTAAMVWSNETEVKFYNDAESARLAVRRRLAYLDKKGISAGGQFYPVTEISDDIADRLEYQASTNDKVVFVRNSTNN